MANERAGDGGEQLSLLSPTPSRRSKARALLLAHRHAVGAALLGVAAVPAILAAVVAWGEGVYVTNPAVLILIAFALLCVAGSLFAFDLFGKRLAALAAALVIGATVGVGVAFPQTKRPITKPTLFSVEEMEQRIGGQLLVVTLYPYGTCEKHSVQDPDREFAFFCRAPDGKWFDPCFESDIPRNTYEMICFLTPWATAEHEDGSKSPVGYGFQRIDNFKESVAKSGDGWAHPWSLELQGGIYCVLIGAGTTVPGGPADQKYACDAKNSESQLVGYIVSDFPDESDRLHWTVQYQPLGGSPKSRLVLQAFK